MNATAEEALPELVEKLDTFYLYALLKPHDGDDPDKWIPQLATELLESTLLFLRDKEAVRAAFDQLHGYVRISVTDSSVTAGTLDCVIGGLNEMGFVANWVAYTNLTNQSIREICLAVPD